MWTVIDSHCRVNDSVLSHPRVIYYSFLHYHIQQAVLNAQARHQMNELPL